jgi:tRNA-dihydrouridine synthase A
VEDTTKIGISVEKRSDSIDRRVSVAPMMEWTDRHCRFFLRLFSPSVLLYTEMIHASAILRGNHARLLQFSTEEQPLALQLGGSDPQALAVAARMAADLGYREINLNCGCPSDKVQAGSFGACLMRQPQRVAECVAAMKRAVQVPVTVKLRIGVVERAVGTAGSELAAERFDEKDWLDLSQFARVVVHAGADALIVHARKAVLGGWSPHENRSVPPLRFEVVERLRRESPGTPMVVNGGIRTAEAARAALQAFDGIMIGREAYHRPWLLAELETQLRGRRLEPAAAINEILDRMHAYVRREQAAGTRAHAITRHMLGLMSGWPGAKELRHLLSAEVQNGLSMDKVFKRAAEIAAQAA